jgi:hypothetical protein
MTIFCVQPDTYFNDEGIHACANHAGMRMFQSAARPARKAGRATLEIDGIYHEVVRQENVADVEQAPQSIIWRFDASKLSELPDLIGPLIDTEGAGHQYVDLNSPARILTLFVDECV